jgi:hypothetical protein
MRTEKVQAGDLQCNSLFIWNSRMYRVISQDEDNYLTVQVIADFWKKNPDSCWLYNSHSGEESFNGYCEVDRLI